MAAAKAEQLPAPVKKEKMHIVATLYEPGPALYALEVSGLIHTNVLEHTFSNGIVSSRKQRYSKYNSPAWSF
jgi:hypothetical protein